MSVLSLRYARAFADVAQASRLDTGAAEQQMRDFGATMSENRPLREVLMDPSIPNEQKLRVVDGIAGRLGMLPAVRNFVAVVMSHRRLAEFDEIVDEYAALADQGSGLTEVEIVTARPIGDDERRTLETRASELAGGRIRTTYSEDRSLLGGAVLRIGSTVYDGSLRGQLDSLKEQMAGGRAV